MHLLVATHDLYPDSGSGGTGRYVYETARRLVDRGHRVSVVTRRRGGAPDRETVAGTAVRRYDVSVADESAPTILPQVPGAARAVARHVRDLSASPAGLPDLVSFQGPVTSLLVDRALPDDVPRTCTFHSPWPVEYAIKTRGDDGSFSAPRRRLNVRVRRALERRVVDAAAEVLTLSQYMARELAATYGRTDARVVPGGVDVERFTPDAGRYDPVAGGEGADTGPTFLTVRRLSRRMGHDLLLDAFARVADARDARLYVAGDGPLRDELEATARERGVADRTTFLGYVPDADLPAAYATADAFVLPTTELEGFGLATLEALASGTPVVGTRVGGTREVLSGLDDLPADPLCDPDADALAARMDEWAALAPAERAAAGRRCREYAREHYAWERTVDALESRYERLVDG